MHLILLKSEFSPEIISLPASQYFFLHASITLSFHGLFASVYALTPLSFLPVFAFSTILLCPQKAPIKYHLTWQRVLGSAQKAHFSFFFSCCTLALLAKMCNLLQFVFLCQQKMRWHCKINYLTICEPSSISLCSRSATQCRHSFALQTLQCSHCTNSTLFTYF